MTEIPKYMKEGKTNQERKGDFKKKVVKGKSLKGGTRFGQ